MGGRGTRDSRYCPILALWKRTLRSSGLCVIGVFFPDVNNDLRARRRFREVYDAKDDPHMTSLERWHALEVKDPDLFGRMHTIFLQSSDVANANTDAAAFAN